jgi:hypothetical protein
MVTIPITESVIICTINVPKSKNSSGFGIPNNILQLRGHHLGKTLAYAYNKSAT